MKRVSAELQARGKRPCGAKNARQMQHQPTKRVRDIVEEAEEKILRRRKVSRALSRIVLVETKHF